MKKIARILICFCFVLLPLTCANYKSLYAEENAINTSSCQDVTVQGQVDRQEIEEVLRLINEERAKYGYEPLKLDQKLTEAAMKRAAETSVYFSHTRPGFSYVPHYITSYGYAENIAYGYSSADTVVNGWINSMGHHINMLDPYHKLVGIGQFNCFWVTDFGDYDKYYVPVSDSYLNSLTSTCREDEITVDTQNVPLIFTTYDTTEHTIDMGQTFDMQGFLSCYDGDGTVTRQLTPIAPDTIRWESSDAQIASVNSNGRVVAISPGRATITGAFLGQTITATVNVTNQGTPVSEMTALVLNNTEMSLEVGDQFALKATKQPANNINADSIIWTSSAPDIVTIDEKGNMTAVKSGDATITASCGAFTAACKVMVLSQDFYVRYCSHVQNIGWQTYVGDGTMSGTEGKCLRLEGIKIKTDPSLSGGISYRTHVQNIGWQDWKNDNQMAGTEGLSYRLEAIQIKLTGDLANKFDVYYRVHCQNIGWMGWAKNGDSAGTAGYAYRLEGIEIKLVEKGGAAPGEVNDAFRENNQ